MQGADLTKSLLTDAILLGTNLTRAILDYAVFMNSKVTIDQLFQAKSRDRISINQPKQSDSYKDEEWLFLKDFNLETELMKKVIAHAKRIGTTPQEYIEGLLLKDQIL